ncbi:hypothetical protein [Deinococcus soli (ex Cha et al. 2016)]|uniref:Uncharacterized protein n=2 Tax=Deinococcus soli (ex Cha et al. 2016) TaxID=1309411 RepID=A0AAE4BNR0_9DEIO|nr:hypothetical protein [Deinococcus soli (ex Cha et al. 2016)]MDR6218976.1 hypothetical protein [Deinococcus soli (ex Cha et al. 2016)]MDR6328773.1 hypothetical protein [Deinococcus soli (ex Cha et al. 2016)]MDR6751740.1 hypothetical protein [Deinococcus soli (ex Cha et al. 2016)]
MTLPDLHLKPARPALSGVPLGDVFNPGEARHAGGAYVKGEGGRTERIGTCAFNNSLVDVRLRTLPPGGRLILTLPLAVTERLPDELPAVTMVEVNAGLWSRFGWAPVGRATVHRGFVNAQGDGAVHVRLAQRPSLHVGAEGEWFFTLYYHRDLIGGPFLSTPPVMLELRGDGESRLYSAYFDEPWRVWSAARAEAKPRLTFRPTDVPATEEDLRRAAYLRTQARTRPPG